MYRASSCPIQTKKVAAVSHYSARFLPGFSTKPERMPMGHASPAMDQKILSMNNKYFQRWHKAGAMVEFFAYFLRNMGKTRRRCSMQERRRALKKSTAERLGPNPTDRRLSGGKIHLHVDGQVCLREWQSPDRSNAEKLSVNGRQVSGGLKFDTSLWTRGMIICESARKSMLTDLRSISAVGGKKSVKAGGIQPAAG